MMTKSGATFFNSRRMPPHISFPRSRAHSTSPASPTSTTQTHTATSRTFLFNDLASACFFFNFLDVKYGKILAVCALKRNVPTIAVLPLPPFDYQSRKLYGMAGPFHPFCRRSI